MDHALRILDACANRAREALRTMEDMARFRVGDADLCAAIKSIRHDLRSALEMVPGGATGLAANRDMGDDVGVVIKTVPEGERAGLRGVALAAGKRAGEALRTIEETTKTLSGCGTLWARVESLRYRLYTAEKTLILAMGSGRARQWRLCVLITQALCRRPWLEVARGAIEGGADCLQLREPGDSDGVLLEKARALRVLIDRIGRETGNAPVTLVINNRVDIALLANADGVHLGTGDLPVAAARELCGDRLLIGVSTHTLAEAESAVRAGADSCGVGAMFETSTKPRPVSGPGYLAEFIKAFPDQPYLAIGGITPLNVGILYEAGCRGVALSACVCRADDPVEACRALLAR